MKTLKRYYIIDRYGSLFIKDRKTKELIDHEETSKYNLTKKHKLIKLCEQLNESI